MKKKPENTAAQAGGGFGTVQAPKEDTKATQEEVKVEEDGA